MGEPLDSVEQRCMLRILATHDSISPLYRVIKKLYAISLEVGKELEDAKKTTAILKEKLAVYDAQADRRHVIDMIEWGEDCTCQSCEKERAIRASVIRSAYCLKRHLNFDFFSLECHQGLCGTLACPKRCQDCHIPCSCKCHKDSSNGIS
jgi:hypothetical protein